MEIKPRDKVLEEIVEEAKENPRDWRASKIYNSHLNAFEYFFLNPEVGIYHIKQWKKNPYKIKGVGGKIADEVDRDMLNKSIGKFGVFRFDPKKVSQGLKEGLSMEQIFKRARRGETSHGIDLGLRGDVQSPDKIYKKYKEESKLNEIDKEFRKLLKRERAFRGYA